MAVLNSVKGSFTAYGQHASLKKIISKTVNDYPTQSILSELVQNADDARATEVHVVFDRRKHPCKSLWSPSMEALQHEAILVFNDKEFLEKDFENITKVASASKATDTSKTGKFGIGFLSTYNITDCPSFVSGNSLCIFDPLLLHVPNATKEEPGVRCHFNADHVVEFEDQFEPFRNLPGIFSRDCVPGVHFAGTMFRFPLRRKASEISQKVMSTEAVQQMLRSLNDRNILLFLKSVRTIRASEITEQGIISITTPLQFFLFDFLFHIDRLFEYRKEVNYIGISPENTIIDAVPGDFLGKYEAADSHHEYPYILIAVYISLLVY